MYWNQDDSNGGDYPWPQSRESVVCQSLSLIYLYLHYGHQWDMCIHWHRHRARDYCLTCNSQYFPTMHCTLETLPHIPLYDTANTQHFFPTFADAYPKVLIFPIRVIDHELASQPAMGHSQFGIWRCLSRSSSLILYVRGV